MMGRIRVAIACAGVLLTTTASARAQTTSRETGSVTTGGYLVWVRGTNASAVELFVGRGFHDAFARAHAMDAAKLQHWIDSVQRVTPIATDDTTSVDASAHGEALGADVSMMRRVGGAHSGLRLLVSGEEPIQMAEPTARDFIVMLDSATRVTLEMSKPGPSLMVGIPAPDVAPAHAPVTTVAVSAVPASVHPTVPPPRATTAPISVAATTTPTPPTISAPTAAVATSPAPTSTTSPATSPATSAATTAPPVPTARATPLIGVPTTTTLIGVPPDSIAAAATSPSPAMASAVPSASMGPSTTEAPPELVLAAPSEPVILLASRVDLMPLPLPAVPIPAPKRVVAAPIADVVATPAATPATTPAPSVATSAASAPTPAAPSAMPDSAIVPRVEAPADKLIRTPLGPFTVPAALLGDRDKEAQYCYAQLGLKYNPDLKGEITVKLSLASDGTVQEAVVTKRSWQGISAGEVESCVRALARDWTFAPSDATMADGAKLLTFSFAP